MDKFITSLRELRKDKNAIQRREYLLCEPQLSLDMVDEIHNLIPDRDTFLMVSIRVFSPRAFVGDRLNHNLRSRLARVLSMRKEYISTLIKIVIFRYDNVDGFKKKVNEAYAEIRNTVIEKNV